MYGKGLLEGLKVTMRHFVASFVEDFKGGKKRYYTDEGIAARASTDVEGIFTVQYPEEKIPVPEEFRFTPFLIYTEEEGGITQDLCTSCGICAKVCPPQCIWIVQTNDEETGRPIPEPQEFFIDIDICMNCGFCAEFCPFDAIKMDHDYELAVYDRLDKNIHNKARLSKPMSYYANIRPQNYTAEEEVRQEKARKKAEREAAKAAKAAAKAAAAAEKGDSEEKSE
jgi:NADH-quinone oxidoreductase subunit I